MIKAVVVFVSFAVYNKLSFCISFYISDMPLSCSIEVLVKKACIVGCRCAVRVRSDVNTVVSVVVQSKLKSIERSLRIKNPSFCFFLQYSLNNNVALPEAIN